MAKSLNQAFIKAYSKETAAQDPSENVVPSLDDFIMRIDTFNVDLPGNHVSKPVRPMAAAVSSSSEPTREENVAAKDENAAGSIRDSIADQMLKATEWLDTDADITESGSLPTPAERRPSSEPADRPAEKSSPERAPKAIHEVQEQDVQQPFQFPSEPEEPPAAGHRGVMEDVDSIARHESPVGGRKEVRDITPNMTTDPNEGSIPKITDADEPAASRVKGGFQGLSAAEVESIVKDYVQRHGRHGEIFRLDRPSYNEAGIGADENSEGPLIADAGSIIFEEHEASQTAWDLDDDLSDEEKNASVKAAEESLRNARVRVFNPVWEVDQLQWPQVCLQLIEQRENRLMRVARNLSAACDQGLQVLAVTSPEGGEGRTTVACCLAKLAAMNGIRVAFVDGDIENPSLAIQTNLDLESDWKDALMQEIPVEEVAVHSIDDQITLIPLLDPIDDQDMKADDDRIAGMLEELAESFDLIVVDTGPLVSERSLAQTMSEKGVVDAVITVVDHRSSERARIEICLEQIRKTGVSSVGLVENFAA